MNSKPFRLSPMQEGLLFHSLSAPDSGLYLSQVTCILPSHTNLALLEKAWRCALDRHGVLRTSFHWQGLDVPLQQEHDSVELPWEIVDKRDMAVEDRDKIVELCAVEEMSCQFDLTRPPLMRIKLVRLPCDDYLFLWTSHHILLDGFARKLVLFEVSKFYEAFCRGEELRLPPPLEYRDYIEWFYRQDFSAAREYWRKSLETFTSPCYLEVVLEDGRPHLGEPFGVKPVELSMRLKGALNALASRHNLTSNIILKAAWAVLLGRYSGQQDVAFGEIRGCRRGGFPQASELVGELINTVPIRADVDPAGSFLDLLCNLQREHAEIRKHEQLPLLTIAGLSGIPRNKELFNSILVFDEYDLDTALQRSSATLWKGIERKGETHYRLMIFGNFKPELALQLHYERAAISDDAAEGIARHLAGILEQVAENPEIRLSELKLLSLEEHQQTVVRWNLTSRVYPNQTCIHRLFEQQVARTPGSLAVVQERRRLTYEELNARANQLAGYLRNKGIGTDVRVGICLERSVDAIVALLAILKAGGAYVPLDPNYPAERIATMIEDSEIELLLTRQHLLEKFSRSGVQAVAIEGLSLEEYATANLQGGESPETLAYVMYTSGSTGKPKGVAVMHRSIARLLFSIDYARLGPEETLLQFAPLGFDTSIFEIFGALLHGGRLVLYPKEELVLEKLGELLREEAVTCVWLTTSLFNLIIDSRPETLAGVRQILVGGEALSLSHIDRAMERLPEAELINGYGPTEGSTFACCYRLPRPRPEGWKSVPIGAPISNTKGLVLDAEGWPCPIGVTGELFIGGDCLARAYLNNPHLTAERFVPNPFADSPGERLYATGDLVRWRPDGLLEFLGRRDNQVKIRGFRIELGDIESTLRRQPGVKDAIVVVHGDQNEKQLIGYVVLEVGGTDIATLKARLQTFLPEYMVPSLLIPLESLPLNANGKLDRKALPAPAAVGSEKGAPRSYVEEVLAGFWAEVLRTTQPGIHSDFFAMGGHSLRAMQLVSRIREAFSVELPLRAVFDHPTIASLAACVDAAMRDGSGSQLAPIASVPRSDGLPLSFSQQRLFFLQQFDPRSSQYNVPLGLRLTGHLDPAALQKALQEIILRHEVLRTRFALAEGTPLQIITGGEEIPLPVFHLKQVRSSDREEELDRLIAEQTGQPFDLSSGLLMRAALVQIGDNEHIFLLTMHHIVSDAWSMEVLAKELAVLYDAHTNSRPSMLPKLRAQYADYAVWQRQIMSGPVLQSQSAYWHEQLAGAATLDLPAMRPRPAVLSYRGNSYLTKIPAETLSSVQALSRREGVTVFMVLLAAFNALLHRYTGSEDISLGTPIAGRTRAEVEGLIGFFVNTLVIRTLLSGRMNFPELLRNTRKTALGAYAHQDIPFERLVEDLQPERTLDRTPLFQVMFSFRHAPQQEWKLGGLEIRTEELPTQTSKFDLTLFLTETAGELQAKFEYSTDLFDPAYIERMAGHFKTMLAGMTKNPEALLGEIPLLSRLEHEQIVTQWNDTRSALPDCSIPELFEKQVKASPNAMAVSYEGRQLTYSELNQRANRLQHYLVKKGIAPGSRVAICMERSCSLIEGMLAVLKAGAAYVPLDPAYPETRLNYMLQDSGAEILLIEEKLLPRFTGAATRIVSIDREAHAIAAGSAENPKSKAIPESLAYLMYTSGSTGSPKAVAVPQKAINRLVIDTNYVDFRPEDRVAQASNTSFDAATFEIWGALLNGAALIGISSEQLLSAGTLQQVLVEKKISILFLTPVMFNQVVAQAPGAFQSLRYLVLGGEAVNPKSVHAVLKAGKPEKLLNGYGPTEATTFASTHEMSTLPWDAQTVPIGKPISNTQLYIVNESFEPVPVGVPGELCIGGPGLAHGYWQRPELTAERFVPHALSTMPGERLYRTGDRARWMEDGTLEFLGRLDAQIKLRGFRVELGEIEASLARYPGIKEQIVLVREEEGGERRLIAYVVPDSVSEFNAAGVRGFLSSCLPAYMVPAAFVAMESLPLTVNGKVDRSKLPVPGETGPAAGGDSDAFHSQTEELLAGIWSVVLRLKHVGIHENFFALGGHSLLAMQVVSRIQDVYGVDITVRDLFECPDLQTLAARVDSRLVNRAGGQTPIRKVERREPPPMSFAQQRLWFLQKFGVGQSTYNVPIALRLRGELQVEALERSIAEIVSRHEALRTTFTEVPNPAQVIHPDGFTGLRVDDLQALATDAREQEVRRLIHEETQAPFGLMNEWPVRVRLLRVSRQDYVLIVTMHHIASDAWSLQIFMRELASLYDAFRQGHPSPLPALAIQYADFAVWQIEWLQGPVLDEHLSYWKNQLQGIPQLLELPSFQQRPPLQTYEGTKHPFLLPQELSQSLHDASRKHGVTLFMTLLAAFQVLLHRYSGQDDLTVGTPIAGRQRTESEPLIGFFVNTLVLRAQVNEEMSFRDLLYQVRETALAAYSYQDLPFEKLVEQLHPQRDMSRTPLFQVLFSLQNQPADTWVLPGLELEVQEIPVTEVKFDLSLAIEETPQGLRCVMSYRTDLFEEKAIDNMARHYQQLLESAITHVDMPVWELPMLSRQERAQVLDGWNQTAKSYQRDQCIHELFEEQVKRGPGRTALIYEGAALSYQELNQRANQVAHYLRRKGIGPEARVGVCMERSPEMVIALLGILKAGGAYVPLDPEHPRDRLAYMLRDSGISALLTQTSLAGVLDYPELICIDKEWDGIGRESQENPVASVVPANLAYVIYTSGSTGVPKGVANEHHGVLNVLHWLQEFYPLTPTDRVMQRTPYTFDVSVPEFFWTLSTGAALVVARPGGHKELEYMVELIETQKVTTMFFVPSLLDALLETRQLDRCGSLTRIFSTGEALPASLHERFFERTNGIELINAYGPTETAVEASHCKCSPGVAVVSIGRPGANTQLYILDAHRQPVPAGIPGELHIAGVQVSRGYVNRPDGAAEKFVPNPFAASIGERMYRTGDLARWNWDGSVQFLGRMDFQVKLRGFRIELGEIESVLMQAPSVLEAVVVLRERADGDKYLVAYLTGREAAPDLDELKAHLQSQLPDYMIPSAFVLLEALPRTGTGKIDRKSLPEPEASVASADYVAPRTPVEEALAGIWAQLLNVPRVGVYDNFFELGGHSLLAIKVISRIRDLYQTEITLKNLFLQPSIAHLAEMIEHLRSSGQTQVSAVTPLPDSVEPPLSYNQEGRLFMEWYSQRRGVRGRPFQLMLGFDWIGAFNPELLESAMNYIVQRHQVLRASFTAVKEEAEAELAAALDPVLKSQDAEQATREVLALANRFFKQKIYPSAPVTIAVKDIQHLSAKNQEAEIADLLNREVENPFNYEQPPLIRMVALHMGPQHHRLILIIHHLVADFSSVEVLLKELCICYQAFAENRAPSLPDLPIQYGDYAAWQRGMLEGQRIAEPAAFWKKQWFEIGVFTVFELKLLNLRPEESSSGSDKVSFDAALRQRVRGFANSHGVTTYIVFLASLYCLLHLHSEKQKVSIWGTFANRTRTESEGVIGWFANFHPLGIELTPEMSLRGVLEEVKTMTLEAHANQEIPFWALWGAMGLRNLNSRPANKEDKSPAPFVMFDFHALMPNLDLANGPSIRRALLPVQSTNMALHMLAWDENEEMGIAVHYATRLFSAAAVRQLLVDFEAILGLLISAPVTPVATLSSLLRPELAAEADCTMQQNA